MRAAKYSVLTASLWPVSRSCGRSHDRATGATEGLRDGQGQETFGRASVRGRETRAQQWGLVLTFNFSDTESPQPIVDE